MSLLLSPCIVEGAELFDDLVELSDVSYYRESGQRLTGYSIWNVGRDNADIDNPIISKPERWSTTYAVNCDAVYQVGRVGFKNATDAPREEAEIRRRN